MYNIHKNMRDGGGFFRCYGAESAGDPAAGSS